MRTKTSFWAICAIAAGALLGTASGCELIATVDRSLIEGTGGTGATTPTGAAGSTIPTGATTGSSTTPPCDPDNCPVPSDECKVAACDANNMCIEENAPDGTATRTQVAGDCKETVCQDGMPTDSNDNMDVEDDMQDCTDDTCMAGMPQHDPLSTGSCDDNGGNVCDSDGTGTCVECNDDMDCTADVNKPVCSMHVCVTVLCINMMPDPGETDVDCGGPTCPKCADDKSCMVANDCESNNCGQNNKCVAGTCNDGILNNSQKHETDVDCGGDQCPACGFDKDCLIATDCIGGQCTNMKCAATCTDTSQNQDETDVDCGGSCVANCANGLNCMGAGDCQSGFCDGTNKCAPCGGDGDCAMNQYCDVGVCVADKGVGATCTSPAQCPMDQCVDGLCCMSAMCGVCQACNVMGAEGDCSNVMNGSQDDTCNAQGESCTGGQCKKGDGIACAGAGECASGFCVDGVCCNNVCSATCKACNVSGLLGTCSNVPANQQDMGTCSGNQSCNGAGVCLKAAGETCGAGSECGSNNCVDGVCCGSANCPVCQACNIAASLGTCSNIMTGQPDNTAPNACPAGNVCSGGACKKGDGLACGGGGECFSTFCVDGVCCNSGCAGQCQVCNATPGTCTPSPAGSDPANECSGGNPNCNGANACGQGGPGVACVPLANNACMGNVDCPAGGVCP